MARRFGSVSPAAQRPVPGPPTSAPTGPRVNAPTTFTKEEHTDNWQAAQRTDIDSQPGTHACRPARGSPA